MNIRISNISDADRQYPYSHRLEFYSESHDSECEIQQWLENNHVKHCYIPYQSVSSWGRTIALYMNEPDVTAFLLKWK